jgi:pimeloyl-ACP methyl ester carboxylesterase
VTSICIGGARLEYTWFAAERSERTAVVLLHEGLGSIAMWKDFPFRLARSLQRPVLAFSRAGYGHSEKLRGPRSVSYMHDEALQVLPELLDRLDVFKPILFGHSDGASIALIHAGECDRPVSGVIAMAPHIFVEEISISSIRAAKLAYQSTQLRERLARYHDDVDGAFWGWNDIWLDPAFRSWNIEASIAKIRCPILAIQGHDDEYGTMRQVDGIAQLAPNVRVAKLAGCAHSPHRDDPEAVLVAVAQWDATRFPGLHAPE